MRRSERQEAVLYGKLATRCGVRSSSGSGSHRRSVISSPSIRPHRRSRSRRLDVDCVDICCDSAAPVPSLRWRVVGSTRRRARQEGGAAEQEQRRAAAGRPLPTTCRCLSMCMMVVHARCCFSPPCPSLLRSACCDGSHAWIDGSDWRRCDAIAQRSQRENRGADPRLICYDAQTRQ